MKIETILLPTDFSSGSDLAARYAADLASQYGAELVVIHVFFDVIEGTSWYAPQIPLRDLSAEVEDSARKQLERFITANFQGTSKVRSKVVRGMADQEILKAATDEKVDLIVIGTHGRTGLNRVLFGSTAEKVVRSATCPVLTVRLPSHRDTST